MITVKQYAQQNGRTVEEVMEMIRDGALSGELKGDNWYVTPAISKSPRSPFVVEILVILAVFALFGGFMVASILWPGDPGDGYTWKSVAYVSSIISATAGIVQCVLFAALAKVISYLSKIEFNTRKSNGIA